MDVYDTYGPHGLQLKVSNDNGLSMRHFKYGQEVPLDDGVYMTGGAIIVVIGGKFVAEFIYLTDKWGSIIDMDDILNERNPVAQAIQELKEE